MDYVRKPYLGLSLGSDPDSLEHQGANSDPEQWGSYHTDIQQGNFEPCPQRRPCPFLTCLKGNRQISNTWDPNIGTPFSLSYNSETILLIPIMICLSCVEGPQQGRPGNVGSVPCLQRCGDAQRLHEAVRRLRLATACFSRI